MEKVLSSSTIVSTQNTSVEIFTFYTELNDLVANIFNSPSVSDGKSFKENELGFFWNGFQLNFFINNLGELLIKFNENYYFYINNQGELILEHE